MDREPSSTSGASLVGHRAVLRRFGTVLGRERLAGAYLFVGPAGVGKRLVAERLAAALFCPASRPDEVAPCGRCESCALIAAGNHPDLLAVGKPEGKSTIPVELLIGAGDERNRVGLCHDLALRPMLASRRVAIIDDADHLSVEGANCLLKTLEEPPPRSVLLLIGTSLARQLPTIRSRTQVVRFDPLSGDEVGAVLRGGGFDLPEEAIDRLAVASAGSVSRAIALADDSLRNGEDAVVACLSASRLDAARLTAVLDEEAKAAGKEPRERRGRLAALFEAAADYYRRRLRADAERAAGGAAIDDDLRALDACLRAAENLSRNANQAALTQWLSIELSRVA